MRREQAAASADPAEQAAAEAFIAKWQGVAASELSTSQSFLIDLCALLGVDAPHATPEQDYMFERPITFHHGDGSTSAGRIDLYRRGAFVLESKKVRAGADTRGFDEALLRARSQAEAYARALPAGEGRPPFVVVVDVGNRIELYSEFSRSGGTYVPFPDPRSHRIALEDLRKPKIRERLRRVWTDPLGLDPSRESARVTREIADRLAKLARSLEQAGHDAELVAQFLMRCLFTMFAEDVRLLPADSFRTLLTRHREQPEVAMRMLAQLWRDMDEGGFSAVLAGDVLKFNGKLFKQSDTLPLDAAQLDLLANAARADWQHVEPAIFGTLLERALSPRDRHKLGAHYTPRAYVERLVLPTVIEPLRKEWTEVQAAALTLSAEVGEANEADSATAPGGKPLRCLGNSIIACATSGSWTRPAVVGISSTSRLSTSSAWKAKCSTPWTNSATARPAWPWTASAQTPPPARPRWSSCPQKVRHGRWCSSRGAPSLPSSARTEQGSRL